MPCQDDHLRDIKGKAGYDKSVKTNISTLIAKLLKRSTSNPEKDIVVKNCFNAAHKLASNMHVHMIAFLPQVNNTSIQATLEKTQWSTVPVQIQDRYYFFLEKEIVNKVRVNIGRCENM